MVAVTLWFALNGEHLTRPVAAGLYWSYLITALQTVAPAVGDIGSRHGGYVARLAAIQCHAVQMAPVLGCQPGDEGRSPDWSEAMPIADRGNAGEQGVDEQRPSVGAAPGAGCGNAVERAELERRLDALP